MRADAKGRIRLGSRLAPQLAIAAVLLALFAFTVPAAVAAEGERVLDLELSLVGGCREPALEAVDKIEDPGCPNNPPLGPHPPSTFSDPRAVATDLHGNIYVSSFGSASNGSLGRIDVFCSDGTFISQQPVPGATSLAIDSDGNLYVYSTSQGKVLRYAPDIGYKPEDCEIEYGETAPVTVRESGSFYSGLAINRDNDHLFGNFGSEEVFEFGSATEGNPVVRTNPGPSWGGGAGMAVDAERDRMYAGAGPTEERIDIFDLNTVVGTPPNDEYNKVGSIESSEVPAGDFGTQVAIAVDEGSGNVFVLDNENCQLYEFDEDGTYLQTISASFLQCTTAGQPGVDNGPESPNGKLSDKGRYLYVPSNRTGVGHSYAFFESIIGPPDVNSIAAANVSETEAELQAEIDPNNAETTYTFQYQVEGTASWTPAGGGTIAGNDPVDVSAPATGLSPGTSYVFRVIATNEKAEGEKAVIEQASFATYPSVPTESEPCANALLRTGPSALLPDCRAYELVTPGDTNARAPLGMGRLGGSFVTRQVSPAGDKVPFRVEGGSLPGLEGTGSLVGDPYLSTRTDAGWSTAYTGPSPGETSQAVPGGRSPDQGHSFYLAGGEGPAVLADNTAYVRYPDGHSELLGQGSLEQVEPEALGHLISEGGGHIIFSSGGYAASPVQLEPEAAPDGTVAVYDRTPDGTTHVVSLKPDETSFGAGEDATFMGASLDGVGIAFEVGTTLYLRYDNEETYAIGTGVEFAGMAEGGSHVFYVQGGDLKRYDALAPEGERVTTFADTAAEVVPATVSADGSTAYFVSESAITGSGPNPEGDSPQKDEQNLYRSVEGQIDFVATVTERDVEGASSGGKTDGLGLWVGALQPPAPQGLLGMVPARSTPDGDTFLFKSRAALTGYDPEDHAQIYRYAAGELQCISCNPTGAAASSDATLQSETRDGGARLMSSMAWPENLRADGRRAFFESSEALVADDSDGLRDVYEWEDQGVGSCRRPEGCVYLISSPQSRRGEYLWAVSKSGDDVFFLSSELLVGSDADETPSIYDARVGGGFAEEATGECEGEGCRPNQQAAPPEPTVLTPVLGPGDQAKPPKRCAKGKHKVKKKGKVRCVKNKKKHHKKGAKKNRAGADGKGGSR